MSKLKTHLTNEVAGIVLEYLKAKKGRLTWISEVTGINRGTFNRQCLAKMKFHRLLRILYALSLSMDEEVFKEWSFTEAALILQTGYYSLSRYCPPGTLMSMTCPPGNAL